MRKNLKIENLKHGPDFEDALDTNLYGWWLKGGWWGGVDNSGAFEPQYDGEDEDATSVVTSASQLSDCGWESNDEDGRRTPTQSSPEPSRESTPLLDMPLSNTELARLLHPRTPEQRVEAQALAAHLASDSIITRSRFRGLHQQERTKVLTTTRQLPMGLQRKQLGAKLSDEEEAEILQYLITSRRKFNEAVPGDSSTSWAEGSSGMGEGGPMCVVCQSEPRNIILWPCRCLSLCDGCRVTLAMNNSDKCVCCRREVGSFSKIFVP